MSKLNYTIEEAITLATNLKEIVTERSPIYVRACVLLHQQNASLQSQVDSLTAQSKDQFKTARLDALNMVAGALWENRQLQNANRFREMVEVMIRREEEKMVCDECTYDFKLCRRCRCRLWEAQLAEANEDAERLYRECPPSDMAGERARDLHRIRIARQNDEKD